MSLDNLQQALEAGRPWVDQHGLWVVALAGFCECLIFAGVIVPGFAIMLAAGCFVASGTLMPHTTLAAAWTGGFLGVCASYAMGRLLGGTRQHSRLQIRDRLHRALTREGPVMLTWYLYASPVRLTLPYLAGATGYPWRPWALYNALGVLPWMAVQLTLGYLSFSVLSNPGSIAYWCTLGATWALTVGTTIYVTRRIMQGEEEHE
jgi:membrane-associated protein